MWTGFWPQLCVEGEESPLGGVVPNVDPLTESLPEPQPPAATLEWTASALSRWLEEERAPDLSWAIAFSLCTVGITTEGHYLGVTGGHSKPRRCKLDHCGEAVFAPCLTKQRLLVCM